MRNRRAWHNRPREGAHGRGPHRRGLHKGSVRWSLEVRAPPRCRGTPSPSRHDMKSSPQIDRTLTLVVLALLIAGCFFVLQPFLTAIIWAAILCATLWPLFLHVRSRLKGRAGLAATLIVLLMAVTVVAPFVIVGITIAATALRWLQPRPCAVSCSASSARHSHKAC